MGGGGAVVFEVEDVLAVVVVVEDGRLWSSS